MAVGCVPTDGYTSSKELLKKAQPPKMDKVLLKFFADILYLKGILYSDELTDIYEAKTPFDLDRITDKMFAEEYSPYKRGEGYVRVAEVTD